MNSKIYRCGWCGIITDEIGSGYNITEEQFQKAVRILNEYGDRKTHKVHGECCQHES